MKFSTEARVGAVAMAAMLILGFMIMFLGGFNLKKQDYYTLRVVFSNVNGLVTGNVVRYAGVECGKVAAINIEPDGIETQLQILSYVRVPKGSKFSIANSGLMGEKLIEITPGTGEPLAAGERVAGEDPAGFDQMMVRADQTLADLRQLIRSLQDVLGDEKVKAAIKDTMLNARDISANLNQMSAVLARVASGNERDFDVIVANLRDMSASLRSVAGRVDTMTRDFNADGQTVREIRETLQNLKAASARVERMAAALEPVITDPETAKNVKETLKNAREASEKANRLLGKVGGMGIKAGTDVLYNPDNGRFRTDFDVQINTSPRNFAVIGVSGVGDDGKLNFQIGNGDEQSARRFGIVENKPGVGLDGKVGDKLKMSLDLYDPNDLRVKLRGEYRIGDETYLVGQTDSLTKEPGRNSYFGIRRSF